MWELIVWLGAFLLGLVIVNTDFPYFFKKNTDTWWYFYFINLYIVQIIGLTLTTMGIYYTMTAYDCTILPISLIIISGFLSSYAVIGFLYSAYDLAGGKRETWLAPSVFINVFHEYIIYIIILAVAGTLGIVGEKLLNFT